MTERSESERAELEALAAYSNGEWRSFLFSSEQVALTVKALRSLAAQDQKPVAWRWRLVGDRSWTIVKTKPEINDVIKFEVEPLYASPPPAAAAPDNGEADAGVGARAGYIKNCHVWPRNGETIFTDPGGTTRVTMDGYAIIPIEKWEALSHQPAPVAANASAEARLREAFLAWIDKRISDTATQQRQAYSANLDVIGSRHHAAQCELLAVKSKFEALSTHPHASDCDKQGETTDADHTPHSFEEAGGNTCRYCGNVKDHPVHSDRTADVTQRELAAISKPAVAANASAELSKFANDLAAKQEPLGVQISAEDLEGMYIRSEPSANASAALQNDLGDMLRALGMSDAAQPKSPHEVFQSAIAEMKRQIANASAEARLREALEPFIKHYEPWMERLSDEDQMHVFSRHTMGDLRRARKALSAHPHASDCDKQGRELTKQEQDCVEAALFASGTAAAELPSDRTADVTCEALASFIKSRAQVDFGGWQADLSRAIIDAFKVGRR